MEQYLVQRPKTLCEFCVHMNLMLLSQDGMYTQRAEKSRKRQWGLCAGRGFAEYQGRIGFTKGVILELLIARR